jgi:hypothetical protein
MKPSIEIYRFRDTEIEFVLQKNVMVNATEMGKVFGKLPKDFLDNAQTKNFINACLKKVNSPFISVDSIDDIFYSQKKSGTWMHRLLALKFAGWLNPDFELWVYHTIDEFIYGVYRRMEESLRESAIRQARIDDLKNTLAINDDYCELQKLELEERQAKYRRSRENKNQLELFKDVNDTTKKL